MGLFSDTARDARRPLAGGDWLRRSAEMESMEEDLSAAAPASGMDTVFRFQKAESPVSAGMLHGASSRTGGEYQAIPSGDPLFAGREAGRPKPSAIKVKGNDDSRQGNSEASELETGQEIRGTERKSDAVVNPAPMARHSVNQSEVMSETLELDSWNTAKPTEVSDGNGNTVNNRREQSLSRLPGRGALPSETSPMTPAAVREEPAVRADGARAAAPAIHAVAAAPANPAAAVPAAPLPARAPARRPPATRAEQEWGGPPARTAPSSPSPPARATAPETPGLVIGRIDVVVVAAPAAAAPARGRDDAGFLSRNYLKRL